MDISGTQVFEHDAECFDLEADLFIPKEIEKFAFNICGEEYTFNLKDKTTHTDPGKSFVGPPASRINRSLEYSPIHFNRPNMKNRNVQLRILKDRLSVEIFVNRGDGYYTFDPKFDPADRRLVFTADGATVKVLDMRLYEMKSFREDSERHASKKL